MLPYCDDDVDYLITLKLDDLLKAWMNNYTNEGRWKYDGFKTFERKMLEKTKLDLGLVDDLALLTINECKDYLSKLDIIATGSKVSDLRAALSESYAHGRDTLNADNGTLLVRQRISLYKQLKKLGDYRKLSLTRLRYFAKRLGITKMRKQTIILALYKFETTHSAEIFNGAKTHTDDVGPVWKKFRTKRRPKLSLKPVDTGPLPKTHRRTNLVKVRDENKPHEYRTLRYCGLQNLGNTCYFNSVIQCLLHCPLARQTIEDVAQHALSVHVLRELRILFNRMTNNATSTFLSPSECFEAVMNAPQCRALSLNNRQEDVHEFLLKLLVHFDEELILIAEVYNLPNIFDIYLRSTLTCQQCSRSNITKEYLWLLSLHLPLGSNEEAPDSVSHALHMYSLMDSYFKVEILHEHRCPQCNFVGGTERKLKIANSPQLLVVHLSRFDSGLQKIDTFVHFPIHFTTEYIRDGNGRQLSYRLTGMIVHKGPSIAEGHYIAYVLIDGNWYEAND